MVLLATMTRLLWGGPLRTRRGFRAHTSSFSSAEGGNPELSGKVQGGDAGAGREQPLPLAARMRGLRCSWGTGACLNSRQAQGHLVSGVPDAPLPLPVPPVPFKHLEMGWMGPAAHVFRCPLAILTQTGTVCSEAGGLPLTILGVTGVTPVEYPVVVRERQFSGLMLLLSLTCDICPVTQDFSCPETQRHLDFTAPWWPGAVLSPDTPLPRKTEVQACSWASGHPCRQEPHRVSQLRQAAALVCLRFRPCVGREGRAWF